MTVKELITELKTCMPGAQVCLGDGHRYRIDVTDVHTPVPEFVQLFGRACQYIREDSVVAALTDMRRVDERLGILADAARIRDGERNADYGDAVENFRRITEIANAITGLELTPAQCCKVMIAVKLARELHNHKRDNLVDLCGYADILELIETAKPVGNEA